MLAPIRVAPRLIASAREASAGGLATSIERGAACVNGRAFAALDRLPEPFLLYLHYLDPHAPYRPPEWAGRRFSADSAAAARGWARRGEPWKIQRKLYHGESGNEFGPDDVRHLSDLYDDEIRFFDDQFDRLVAELVQAHGRIDILVNAVGGSTVIDRPAATTEELSFADWQKVITFNLDATFHCTHAVIPEADHPPLRQRMVLLKRAGRTAEEFYAYLQHDAARAIFRKYGYGTPRTPAEIRR